MDATAQEIEGLNPKRHIVRTKVLFRLNLFLGIQPNEAGKTWASFAIHFIQQLSAILFMTSVTGFYVSSFDASTIPIAALALNGFNTLFLLVCVRGVERYGMRNVIMPITVLASVSMISLSSLFMIWENRWIYAVAYVLTQVYFLLPRVIFWPYLNGLYDTQQSKRLFGFIGSSRSISIMLSGAITPLLVLIFGSKFIPFIACIMLPLQIPLYRYLARQKQQIISPYSSKKLKAPPQKITLRLLIQNRYLLLLSLAMSCFAAVYAFADYQFLTALKSEFTTDELTSFLGAFFGVVFFAQWMFESFLTARLLNHFGVGVVNLIKPVAVLVIGIVTLILPETMLVWGFVALKASERGLSTFFNTASNLLFRPVDHKIRDAAQSYIGGVIDSIASVVSYVFLLAITREGTPITLLDMSYIVIAICIGWTVCSVMLRNEYVVMLKSLFQSKHQKWEFDDLQIYEVRTLQTLFHMLESSSDNSVLHAIQVLRQQELQQHSPVGESAFQAGLLHLLEHPSDNVRMEALNTLAERETDNRDRLADYIWSVVSLETSTPILGQVIHTYCALKEEGALTEVANLLSVLNLSDINNSREIQAICIVGMCKYGGVQGIFESVDALKRFINSDDVEDKIMVADILGEIAIPTFYQPLLKLLEDERPDVRRAALAACGEIQQPKLIRPVVRHLQYLKSVAHAIDTLKKMGPRAVEELEEILNTEAANNAQWKVGLIRALCDITTAQALEVLQRQFERENSTELLTIMAATFVKQDDHFIKLLNRDRIEQLVNQTCQNYYTNLHKVHVLERTTFIGRLKETILAAMEEKMEYLFHLIYLLYPSRSLGKLHLIFQPGNTSGRADAMELLDSLLPTRLKEKIFPILEDVSIKDRLAKVSTIYTFRNASITDHLDELMRPQPYIKSWIRVVTIHKVMALLKPFYGSEMGRRFFLQEGIDPERLINNIESSLRLSNNSLVREIALEALCNIHVDISHQLAQQYADDPDEYVRHYAQSFLKGKAMSFTIEKILLLKGIDLFADANDEALAFVVHVAEEEHYAEGDQIFAQGDPGDALYLILNGRVRLIMQEDEKEIEIAVLTKGDSFGEYGVLDAHSRPTSAMAVTDCVLLRIDRDDLFHVLEDHIEIVKKMFVVLMGRLRKNLAPTVAQLDEENKVKMMV